MSLRTGCGGVQATIPEVVQVPVPVSCIDAPVARPDFVTDAELAAIDDYKLPLALAIDRRLRQAYEAHLEATVTGC